MIVCETNNGRIVEQQSTFTIDSTSELSKLPTAITGGTDELSDVHPNPAKIGSICKCGNDGSGLITYMLFSNGWVQI